MCRPTENIEISINKGFILESLKEQDYEELALVQIEAYREDTPAISLYNKLGFISGGILTDLVYHF